MKAAILLALALIAVSNSTAGAEEIVLTCAHETQELDKPREQGGEVSIAIDTERSEAELDYGEGWSEPIALKRVGSKVEEADPPGLGMSGAFYFDLASKTGGIGGGMGLDEFFTECMQRSSR